MSVLCDIVVISGKSRLHLLLITRDVTSSNGVTRMWRKASGKQL